VPKQHHSSFTSIYVNRRFLLAPQKSVWSIAVKKALHLKNQQLKQLRSRLDRVTALSADIEEVIHNDDFKQEQQVCMALHNNSVFPTVYDFDRWQQVQLPKQVCGGIHFFNMVLPSRWTLRDYTYWMKLKPGFNAEVLNHLQGEANVDSLASWQR